MEFWEETRKHLYAPEPAVMSIHMVLRSGCGWGLYMCPDNLDSYLSSTSFNVITPFLSTIVLQ